MLSWRHRDSQHLSAGKEKLTSFCADTCGKSFNSSCCSQLNIMVAVLGVAGEAVPVPILTRCAHAVQMTQWTSCLRHTSESCKHYNAHIQCVSAAMLLCLPMLHAKDTTHLRPWCQPAQASTRLAAKHGIQPQRSAV